MLLKAWLSKLHRSVGLINNPYAGWLVLILALILTLAAYWIAQRQVESRAQEQFRYRALEISDAIRDRAAKYEQVLRGGVGLFHGSDEVTREEWRRYVKALELEDLLPGIQGMGFARAIKPEDKEAHIQSVRAEGFTDYDIRPEGRRDFYSAIEYIEPFSWRNKRAFGFDMWSHPARREAMLRAWLTGEPATTGIVTLVQETEQDVQRGFLTYLPVYFSGVIPKDEQVRREDLKGWVYAPFRTQDLMRGILGWADTKLAFEIYDGPEKDPAALLYDSDRSKELASQPGAARFSFTDHVEMQGRQWTIHYHSPDKAFLVRSSARHPRYILIAGLLVDLLLLYVLISLYSVNRHARATEERLQKTFEHNQQRLAEQAEVIESSRKEANVFFELAPDAFLVVDGKGAIVKANQQAHRLFEYPDGTLQGIMVEALIPRDLRAAHRHLRQHYQTQPTSRLMERKLPLQALKRSGETFPVSINLMPIIQSGQLHTVAAVHDISVQKKVEQTLQDAKERAESASQSKSEFVANMSHEIRTPLNAVIGSARLLEKTHPSAQQKNYLRMLRVAGDALLGVVNDILDFSKIEAGCLELAEQDFNLDDLLARVAVMMSASCEEKEIELVVHVDPKVERHLRCDALRLQQILINLISNAIKFTDAGKVILKVCLVDESDQHQSVRFSVQDTGIGMNAQQQARLFRAFSQADSSITRRFGGTGLGLVICSEIAQMMHSQIEVRSELNRGSTFEFELQLGKVERVAISPNQPAGHSVLILDDQPDSLAALKAIFERWRWPVQGFASPSALWSAMDQGLELDTFDLVVIDYGLQHGKGTLRTLRQRGLSERALTILSTTHQRQASLLSAKSMQSFDAVLAKPITAVPMLDALTDSAETRTFAFGGAKDDLDERSAEPLQGITILLVEDNLFNQAIARGLLEDLGAELDVVNNGREAVQAVTATPEAYQLILMDVQMPIMDGLTATRIMREELGCTVPIVALTAGVLQAERSRCLAAGMNDLLAKPVDTEAVLTVLKNVLHPKSPAAFGQEYPGSNTDYSALVVAAVFNPQRLLDIAKDKPERLQAMAASIQVMVAQHGKELAEVQAALGAGDFSKAQKILHGMKGAIANYGGERAAQSLQVLEDEIKAHRICDETIAEVKLELEAYSEVALVWANYHMPGEVGPANGSGVDGGRA